MSIDTRTPVPDPLRAPAPPTAGFDRLSGQVARDLDDIFRNAPAPAAAAPPAATSYAPGRPGRAARLSLASLGALATAGLLGIAAGAVITRPPGPPVPPPAAAATVAEAPRAAPATPVAAPTPAPEAAPPVQTVAATPEPAPKPRKASVKRASAAPTGRCARLSGAARARCAWPDVISADRRLRRAYAHATRAGVSRATLASYRGRWNRLRGRAQREPHRVIAGYRGLAADLDRLAARARRA